MGSLLSDCYFALKLTGGGNIFACRFASMDPSMSGRGAAAVFRDEKGQYTLSRNIYSKFCHSIALSLHCFRFSYKKALHVYDFEFKN